MVIILRYSAPFLFVLAVAAPVSAQSELRIKDAARVRVDAPHLPERLFGNAATLRAPASTFTISTPGDDARVTMPLSAVQRIQVSEGRPRLLYAAAGAAAGFLLGGVAGGKLGDDSSDPKGMGAFVGVVAGASGGLTVGAIVGFAYAPERWRTVYSNTARDSALTIALREGARVRQLDDGTIAVRGERNRRAGVLRGALALGGVAVVFGGIDTAQGDISGGDYIGTIVGNAFVGGAIGYLISPRGWQKLPAVQR